MAKDGSDAEPTQFVKLPDPTTGAFVEADVRSYLKKWDLAGNSRVHRFRYTRPFHRMDPEPFLRDFFDSDVVREHFEVVDAKGQWRSLTDAAGASAGARCVGVRHEIVPCAVTSMAHFDSILERADPPIVREGTDALLKRVDDVIEGFTVADELRDFILNESSENAHLVGEDARAEFLFRLFSHCALGGSMCQFEDSITPYLDVTKRLYKALVNAKKDPNADVDQPARAVVASDVYAVSGVTFAGAGDGDGDGDGDGNGGLFPRARNRQNFCYLCVDPWKRHVTVWYHGFRAYW